MMLHMQLSYQYNIQELYEMRWRGKFMSFHYPFQLIFNTTWSFYSERRTNGIVMDFTRNSRMIMSPTQGISRFQAF